MIVLEPFQKLFIRETLRPEIDISVLSLPRGNGKSSLAAHICVRSLTPGDPLFEAGKESVLYAPSLEQSRIVFRFVRADLEGTGDYRFQDSSQHVGVLHVPTNTRLRGHGSNPKGSMGLVNCPLAIIDEGGSLEAIGGELLHTSIATALGKPGSKMKAIYIGTISPATRGWWPDLIKQGSRGSTYVQVLQCEDLERWDSWQEIKRCNPLTKLSPEFAAKLKEERNDARHDSRLKARFLSYRLNRPTGDESTMLLTVNDWERVRARPVPERDGLPVVGVDLGAGRAWHSAVAIWPNGRVEAVAVCPGIPDCSAQEKRDVVERGTYQRLIDQGRLIVADGLRVQPPGLLAEAIKGLWGKVAGVVADRFRANELADSLNGTPLSARVSQWSESSADIRALRKLAKDGPLACSPESRALIEASLAVSCVENDKSGNCKLVKIGTNNKSRDDVAQGLVLAGGVFERTRATKKKGGGYLGTA